MAATRNRSTCPITSSGNVSPTALASSGLSPLQITSLIFAQNHLERSNSPMLDDGYQRLVTMDLWASHARGDDKVIPPPAGSVATLESSRLDCQLINYR